MVGAAPTELLGIQEAAQKGIAGRGVLLDFAGWAEAQNITYNAFASSTLFTRVPLPDLSCISRDMESILPLLMLLPPGKVSLSIGLFQKTFSLFVQGGSRRT